MAGGQRYLSLLVVMVVFLGISYIIHFAPSWKAPALRSSFTTLNDQYRPYGSLGMKSPLALPSIPVSDEEEKILQEKRGIYGGVRDKIHLGGFTNVDECGISNNTFNFMFGPLGIRSIVDVGCGKGVSTTMFQKLGAKVLCVEGSHDAVTQSLLAPELVVEHDFTRGPWWPEETFDAVWAVEFLEHVGRQYIVNYVPIFRRSALLFLTHSAWGGWHHVEVHPDWWWQARFEALGFHYSKELTELVRLQANNEKNRVRGQPVGQHIRLSMQVFINPAVASLAKHAHLFAGYGCFNQFSGDNLQGLFNAGGGEKCDNDFENLPSKFQSLLNCRRDPLNEKSLWACKKNPEFAF